MSLTNKRLRPWLGLLAGWLVIGSAFAADRVILPRCGFTVEPTPVVFAAPRIGGNVPATAVAAGAFVR